MSKKQSVWQRVSKKAVKELLQEDGWQQDEDSVERLRPILKELPYNVYVHADGRGLYVIPGGTYRLYPLKADMFAFFEEVEQLRHQRPYHILEGRLPDGQDFIQSVPRLIEELPAKLKIKPEALDGSFASLQIVETAVKRKGYARSLEPEIFAPLVAYIGEAMRRAVDGHWEMKLSPQDQTIWEPWIVDPQGRACNSWSYLYDLLNRDGDYTSISGGANVTLNFRRHLPNFP